MDSQVRKQFGDVVEELATCLTVVIGGEEFERYIAELATLNECSDSSVFISRRRIPVGIVACLMRGTGYRLWIARVLRRLDIATTLVESLHSHIADLL